MRREATRRSKRRGAATCRAFELKSNMSIIRAANGFAVD
jgi:hypothetical protein